MAHQSPWRPPRYSTLSFAPLPVYPNAAELDVDTDSIASRNDLSKEAFDFCLESSYSSASSRHAWATLRLWSVVSKTSQRPRYVSGENVEGSVILDLKRPQMIHSVVVLLRGRLITSSLDEGSHLFMEVIQPIWSGKDDRPTGGKLQGRHEWPFSFPFPTTFQDKGLKSYPTPQTVLQRGINANVMYEVVVKINHGLLHTKQRINANVLYVPILRAPPLPPLRASAYFNGAPSLVGPVEDRGGWSALPSSYLRVSTRGEERAPSTVDVKCTGYIAKPAVYTRGTVIPCYLICEVVGEETYDLDAGGSSSSSILRAMTSRKTPLSMKLIQNVRYSQDPQKLAAKGQLVKAGQSSQDKDERAIHLKQVGEAVWWTPTSGGSTDPGKRSLEGEIHLDAGLLPSTDIPFLEVSYAVSLSFNAGEGLEIQPLTTQRHSHRSSSTVVKIGTANDVESPIPVPFTARPAVRKRDLSTVENIPYFSRGRTMGP